MSDALILVGMVLFVILGVAGYWATCSRYGRPTPRPSRRGYWVTGPNDEGAPTWAVADTPEGAERIYLELGGDPDRAERGVGDPQP